MDGNAGECRTIPQEFVIQVDSTELPTAVTFLELDADSTNNHSEVNQKGLPLEFRNGRDSVRSFASQYYVHKAASFADEIEPLSASKRGVRLVIDQRPCKLGRQSRFPGIEAFTQVRANASFTQ